MRINEREARSRLEEQRAIKGEQQSELLKKEMLTSGFLTQRLDFVVNPDHNAFPDHGQHYFETLRYDYISTAIRRSPKRVDEAFRFTLSQVLWSNPRIGS